MWKKWLDPLEWILIIILAGFLFWPNAVLPASVFLLVLIRLFRDRSALIPSKNTFLLLIPAYITLIAWILGGAVKLGWKEVELWGLALGVFLYFQNRDGHELRSLQQSFILWSLLQAFILLIFLVFTESLNPSSFSQQVRDAIEHRFHIHPTYITAAWSWALLLFWMTSKMRFIYKTAISILFLVIISLTGGKMPILALGLVGLILILKTPQISLKSRIGALAIVAILSLAIFMTPVMQVRFAEIALVDLSYSEGQMLSSTELRIGVWSCSLNSILENPWLGVGIGNTREALEQCFEQFNQVEFFEGEYNTHNQFMHFWLSSGIFGLLAFVVFIAYMLLWSIKSKRHILFYFLVYFIIISLTENYFSRQLGMVLWAIFISTALLNRNDKFARDET